ncbi:PTS sugar transporter subunit IIC [Clostridium polynesiense]|uniref:PTS sugar transporter subunit IIC n=1 Tax=Clostridium polynesiense TaxID=1325933 RepID=UPI00058C8B63|nr:PTS transporter subunit EIIC [Clostridium polynesiense]
MQRFSNFIEKKIAPTANRLSRQKYLQALQNTFLALVPLFTLGSFSLVITSPPMDYTTMEAGVLRSIMQGWQMIADALGPILNYVFLVTMPLMSLYVAIGIGYFLAKHYKMQTIIPIFITAASFVISASMSAEGNLSFTYFEATGLFTAILVSITTFEFYRLLVEKKVGRIELGGSGVPPALSDSIGNLVPVLIVLITVATLNNVIFRLTGNGLPALMTLIMSPIVAVVDNVWGVIILAVVVMLFWWFGIHDSVITSALDPFFYSNLGANATAFAAGTAAASLPFIVTTPFWWNFMAIGGSGATLGLAFLALRSKSKQIKAIGKISFIPSLFNINEPLIFGLPLMYNPIMMIPFILVMPLNGLITYFAMSTGLVARTFAYASWNMFSPIAALIDTLDIKALLLVVGLIIIDMIIYLPFFKVYEKQKIKEESEN